ncbi:DDB1- and CUL4-associated factor 15-like [Larus michahellis]|uniref:DDB1- and CUL4-associated factor 15-like n=1 Tax=Larus michahellis TaxID=119627 RepID=UPI003D9BE4F5
MAAGSKSEARGPGGQRGPAGGPSVGSGPPGSREHVVRQLDRLKDEEPYSELYPGVCEGLSDSFKVIVFGFKGISPVTAMFPPSTGCLLHTSFSLGACAIAVHVTGDTSSCQMLWECRSLTEHLGKGEMSE